MYLISLLDSYGYYFDAVFGEFDSIEDAVECLEHHCTELVKIDGIELDLLHTKHLSDGDTNCCLKEQLSNSAVTYLDGHDLYIIYRR